MGSRYIAPNVTVSKYFQIGPEPIVLGSVSILPPTAKSKDGTQALVNIKLLSNEIRDGMQELPLRKGDLETSSNAVLPMSDQLLMHIHGGGFIATSSTTHEVLMKSKEFHIVCHYYVLGLSETLGIGFRNSHRFS